MLTKELIRRIRKLEITTRQVVSDLLAGQYHSVFKGRGMAFAEVRPYQAGDEIRFIDWNVTARMNEPFVKVFTEERELTVMLLVDVSASKEFGSTGRAKAEVAAEVAAQLAFSAIANNDRVGLILFSDRVEKVIPPKKGKKHVLRVVSDILSFEPKGQGTDLSVGLHYVSRIAKRRAVTFLVSDFLAEGYEQAMRVVASRHDLIPVVLIDPLESSLPSVGLAELEDPETGARALVDLGNPLVRGRYAKAFEQLRAERISLFRKLSLDFIELKTGEAYAQSLARFFRQRAKRMAA